MVTKRFPGNFTSLILISNFIVEQAEAAGFTPEDVYAIQIAVDEASSNIIDHAYGGENLGDIEIAVREERQSLRIILRDHGKPFDPTITPEPDIHSPLEIRKERGLGIYFMRKMMDQVLFEFSPRQGNKLILVKNKRA